MKILVTGSAGFIGFHLSKKLLDRGDEVIGIDNLNDYYDVSLKLDRNKMLKRNKRYRFYKIDICDRKKMDRLFKEHKFEKVCHLAAQAGVRYSLKNPYVYIDSNISGFLNILEGCKNTKVDHLVYASSSSVYGANTKMPFSVHDNVDHPVSLYAATKKANELMAHTYASLYNLPSTGLRFFTVYGPWGRPDMALFIFTKAILKGKTIDVYNYGNMKRDFTYIDDIVEGVMKSIDRIPTSDNSWDRNNSDPSTSYAPYKIYNIGNHKSVDLKYFISVIEANLGKKAKIKTLPIQKGDVPETYADIDDLKKDIGFAPSTPIEEGVKNFIKWYLEYYSKK